MLSDTCPVIVSLGDRPCRFHFTKPGGDPGADHLKEPARLSALASLQGTIDPLLRFYEAYLGAFARTPRWRSARTDRQARPMTPQDRKQGQPPPFMKRKSHD